MYAIFNELSAPENLGLHVEGLGAFGLLVSDHDAKVVIQCCQSPFAKGTETIVD